ncbi:MAG: phytoene desaturase [Candidatus Omnitrophica bacterium]|nr:phytoene desaturase [Candidatus Omnitrophota bacterium]
MSEKIAIVGAGVGGLATAARLSYLGYDVEVYEKLPECGGRAHLIEDSGFKFDTGPSFVLMPDFFKEIFDFCGKDIVDYLELVTLDINYKIFYPDGKTLTIYKDRAKTEKELEKIEPGASFGYQKFLEDTGKIYQTVKPLLYKCFSKLEMIKPSAWALIKKLNLGKTYWQLAQKYFKSLELCYAFTFEAMFIGVSPFSTPSFYSVITYSDHVEKIRHPMGGMYQIPLALEKMAKEFGAKFRYNFEVKKIAKKDHFVIKSDDETKIADKVVVNADWPYTNQDILKRKLPKLKYSCSVYLIYLGLKKKVESLEHHNLFFAKDLPKNLADIFTDSKIPEDPSFYIHVPTRTDPDLAPEGKDIAYILVPVPNLEKEYRFKEYEEMVRDKIFDIVQEKIGVNLKNLIEVERRFYPDDFIKRYNILNAATFGLSHNFFQSAFFRPNNVDQKIKGLYHVGASTQPGGGLPTVIASSKIVADLIRKG